MCCAPLVSGTTSVMTHFAPSSWEPELFWPSNVCDKGINVKQFTKMLNTRNEHRQWVHVINKKRDLYLFCQNWNLQPTIFYNYTCMSVKSFQALILNCQWKSQECKTHNTCRQRDNRWSGSDESAVILVSRASACADCFVPWRTTQQAPPSP